MFLWTLLSIENVAISFDPHHFFLYICKKGVEESVAESRLMGKQTLGEKQIIAPSPTVEHSVHFVDIIRQQGRCLCHISIPRSFKKLFPSFPDSPCRPVWPAGCGETILAKATFPGHHHHQGDSLSLMTTTLMLCNGRAYLYNFPPRMGTHPHTSQQNVAPLASCKNCSNLTRTLSPRAGWFLWFLLQWILQQTLLYSW